MNSPGLRFKQNPYPFWSKETAGAGIWPKPGKFLSFRGKDTGYRAIRPKFLPDSGGGAGVCYFFLLLGRQRAGSFCLLCRYLHPGTCMPFENLLLYALAICGVVQLFYALYYFLPLAFHADPVAQGAERPVSVLVCAHNELANLRRLVPALLAQEYPAFELVMIDDRSTDGTDAYLKNLAKAHATLKLVRVEETPPGLSPKKHGLTQGVLAACHPFLLFTDADCLPESKGWIREMQNGFQNGAELVLGYSSYSKTLGFLNVLIRYETLLTAIQYLSFAKRGQPYMGVGRNLAYTKQCFYRNQGYASHIKSTGGDDDLFVRDAAAHTQANIVISKDAQTQSIPKDTYQKWIFQKKRHLSAGLHYKFIDKIKIGAFILSNVLFYVIALTMLFSQAHLVILGLIFGGRCLVLFFVYYLISRRLKEDLSVVQLPVVDLAYFLQYLVLGVSVLRMKKEIKWK
jgi:glycosyltransferase involved in cell wall biosynthesis